MPTLAHHYMPGGGGIVAMEGYHAGSVRTLLYQAANQVVQPFGVTVGEVTSVGPAPSPVQNPDYSSRDQAVQPLRA